MCLAVLLFLLFPLEFSFTIQIQKRAMCSKGVRQKLARGAHFSRKLQSLQCIDLNMFLSLSLQLRWVEGYYAGRQTLRREIFFPQASSPLGSGWTNMFFWRHQYFITLRDQSQTYISENWYSIALSTRWLKRLNPRKMIEDTRCCPS